MDNEVASVENKFQPRKALKTVLVLAFVLAAIPITVKLAQTVQELRSRASGTTADAAPKIVGLVLPSITGFQSDLFTGTATVSYPISLPAGPGGLKPNLALSYSSGGVDDSHGGVENWQGKYSSQAGLAGLGWSLSGVDNITRGGNDYYLTVGGASYTLVSNSYDPGGKPTSEDWQTSPKGFLRIKHRPGNYGKEPWVVTTKDGVKYIFGETDDYRAWNVDTSDPANPGGQVNVVYRWVISKIIDTHNNNVQFNYEKEEQKVAIDAGDAIGDRTCAGKEEGKNFVRAIRPTLISWNNSHYQVQLVWEPRDDGNLGAIIPGEREGNSCKQTQYTDRRLKEILVKVDGSLLRKYSLDYRYTRLTSLFPLRPIVHSLLERITMFGTDGATSIPPYAFSYAGEGNEAYLERADNGYGASVTYGYTPRVMPGIVNTRHTSPDPRAVWGRERYRVNQRVTRWTENGQTHQIVNTISYLGNGYGYYFTTGIVGIGAYEFLGYGEAEEALFEKEASGSDPLQIVNKTKKYFHQETSVTQNVGGREVTLYYPDPRKGRAFKTEVKNKADQILTVSNEGWQFTPAAHFNEVDASMDKNYMPFVFLERSQNTIEGKTTATSYLYDNYGNTAGVINEGDTSVNGDEQYTETEYYYMDTAANYMVSKPKTSYIYRGLPSGAHMEVNHTGYYYDNQGWGAGPIKGDVTAVDKAGGDIHVVTRTKYDEAGNPIEVTDALGNATKTDYDTTYRTFPIKVTNALGQFTTTEYSYVLGVPVRVVDINGVATSFEYDALGRAKKIIKAGDSAAKPSIEYVFKDNDPSSKAAMVVGTKTRVESGTDEIIESYQFYNGLGQLIQEQAFGPEPGQIIVNNTVYNSMGKVVEKPISYYLPHALIPVFQMGVYQMPLATLTAFTEYDALGRVTKVTNIDKTITTTGYNGFTKTITNEEGVKKYFENDGYGNLVKMQEFNGSGEGAAVYATTLYEYDLGLGVMTKVIDAKGNQTIISYDGLGRKTSMKDPDLGLWQYQYDLNGNLIRQIDAKSQSIRFEYDALSRVTRKIYPTGVGVQYFYDEGANAKGKRTRMVDASGSTQTEYDERGRVVKETKVIRVEESGDNTFVTQFTYDGMDRVKTITYPDNEQIKYTYNRAGQPLKLGIAGGGMLVSNTTYNAVGQIKKQDYGNSTSTEYAYNGSLRLGSIKTSGASGDLFLKNYSYDKVGNILGISDGITSSETENFSYDKLNRLTGADGAYRASYTYDVLGNILTKTEGEDIRTLSYNNPLHVHAPSEVFVSGSLPVNYTYDANGNLTKDEAREIEYDFENRPVTINMTGGQAVRFVYDGDGVRVAKVENGKTTLYVGEMEKDLTSGQITKYYSLGGKRVAVKDGEGVKYILSDHLGSLAGLASQTGSKLSDVKYYPYGSIRQGSGLPSRQYTGQINDETTGLYFYNARYYNPKNANFITADTGGSGLNKYVYVSGNPIVFSDPTGNEEQDCTSNPMSSSCMSLNPVSTYTPVQATLPLTAQPCYSQEECQANQEFFVASMALVGFIAGGVAAGEIIGPASPVVMSQIGGVIYGARGFLGNFLGRVSSLFREETIEPALTRIGAKILEKITGIPTVIDISGYLGRVKGVEVGSRAGGALRTPLGGSLPPEIVLSPSKQFSTFAHEATHALQYTFNAKGSQFFGVKWGDLAAMEKQAYAVDNNVEYLLNGLFSVTRPLYSGLYRLRNVIEGTDIKI